MVTRNSKRLVLCQDSATGFVQIGWDTDLPPGRFVHLEVIGESAECHPLTRHSPHYASYQAACARARQLNAGELAKQIQTNIRRGRLPVPLDLHADTSEQADEVGLYLSAAMQALHRLTANCREVWAVVARQAVIHIEPCRPVRAFDELAYQVWKHHTLSELQKLSGDIRAGKLIVQESGLWFETTPLSVE